MKSIEEKGEVKIMISESGNFEKSFSAPKIHLDNDTMKTVLIDGQLYMTAAEYRAALKLGPATVYRWSRTGLIHTIKLGGTRLVRLNLPVEALAAMDAKRRVRLLRILQAPPLKMKSTLKGGRR